VDVSTFWTYFFNSLIVSYTCWEDWKCKCWKYK